MAHGRQVPQVMFYLNDNLLTVSELTDEASGALLNAAAVAVTLEDTKGREVAGETWPLSLAAAGSGGNYTATLSDALKVRIGQEYRAIITANAGVGKQGRWVVAVKAEERHV